MNCKIIGLYIVCMVTLATNLQAQDFITRVKIEFEKKVNFKRALEGNNTIPDNFPKYDITYFNFLYAGGVSLYHFDHEIPAAQNSSFRMLHDQNSIFFDYNSNKTVAKKSFFGEEYILKDTIYPIKWRIMQETRNIAGYECRKAVGRVQDSIYIVAFYCEQFVMKAGPEAVQGLPGMILGMAIPKYNTTWFATKVELANINESSIVPPSKGKKLSEKELTDLFMKKFKEYGMKDITPEKVRASFGNYIL
jgi:GLPGLI family protein